VPQASGREAPTRKCRVFKGQKAKNPRAPSNTIGTSALTRVMSGKLTSHSYAQPLFLNKVSPRVVDISFDGLSYTHTHTHTCNPPSCGATGLVGEGTYERAVFLGPEDSIP